MQIGDGKAIVLKKMTISPTISFTGIDGCGKSTQIAMLLDWFKHEGYSCISVYELSNPEDYSDVSDFTYYCDEFLKYDVVSLRFYLNSKRNRELQKKIMYGEFFHDTALAREVSKSSERDARLWHEHVINKLKAANKIILFDRYYFDEIAYRLLYGVELSWLEYLYKDIATPSLSFLLDIDIETAGKRNKKRIDGSTTLFQYTKKLRELHCNLEFVARRYNMIKLYGVQNSENIHRDVIRWVNKII